MTQYNFYKISKPHSLTSWFCASNKILNKIDSYKIELVYQNEYNNKDDIRIRQVLDNLREYNKLQVIKRKDKIKQHHKKYYEANKDTIKQQQQQYQQANRDRINQRRRTRNALKRRFLNILND
jgi:hypothetical protein